MSLNDGIYGEVAEKLGISKVLTKHVVESFYSFVRERAEAVNLYEGMTLEEFERERPNINIPSLGKFSPYCWFMKRSYGKSINKNKENK